jgi:hypothetical protein
MEQDAITAVCKRVYRQFPALQGRQPRIKEQEDGKILLVFEGSAPSANGRMMPINVRVVTDAKGKVIKLTSSR